jgi:hypothetical protein
MQSSFGARTFKCIVHTCGNKMEIAWTVGSSADERGFRSVYSMIQRLYNSSGWPTFGGLNFYRKHSAKYETVAKTGDK